MWCFYCCFSYHALLELNYEDKWHKSLATKEWAKEEGLSIQEAKCCLDVELFLNEYPWWDVRGLHHPFILQRMFVHAAESRQKEVERLIHCHGHWCGLPRLDPKVDVPAIQLVGYQTSREEIGDLFHQVYMLKRLPRPPLCRPKWACGGNQGHFVFLEGPPMVEERWAVRRK